MKKLLFIITLLSVVSCSKETAKTEESRVCNCVKSLEYATNTDNYNVWKPDSNMTPTATGLPCNYDGYTQFYDQFNGSLGVIVKRRTIIKCY